MLRMSSPSQVDNEVVFCCTTIFRISTSTSVSLSDWCHYGKMPILQHISATRIRSIKICTIPQLSSYSERCNARSIRDIHLKADILLIILPRIIRFSFVQQMILIKTFWLFFYGESLSENFGAMLQRTSPEIRVCKQTTKGESDRRPFVRARNLKSAKDDESATYPRERGRSHKDISSLWHPSIWKSPGAQKQINRYVQTSPHPHDHSWRSFQKLSFKDIRKMEDQEGQDWGDQEVEDEEKRWWMKLCRLTIIILDMTPTIVLDVVFIFFLTTVEFIRNARAFWLTTISRLEQLGPNAGTFWIARK